MSHINIPHNINDPETNWMTAPENKLYRPQINFLRAFIILISVIVATALFSCYICKMIVQLFNLDIHRKIVWQMIFSVYWKLQLFVLILTLRFIIIWFIRIYQRYAKSETRLRCHYTPSCSEYTILALKKYGLVYGCYKAFRRFKRCDGREGIDYP